MQVTKNQLVYNGTILSKSDKTRKDSLVKENGYWSKLGVGMAIFAAGVVSPSAGHQISITSTPSSGIHTSYNAYTIDIDGMIVKKNGDLEVFDVKKTRRVNNGKLITSKVVYTDTPSFPKLEFIENDELLPQKHILESETSFALEYAGKLPKRPRI